MAAGATPPVVLLGGLSIVRALGLAKIPVIVASPERRTPATASRYCSSSIALPPASSRGTIVAALVREGRRLADRHGAPPPLFYSNDDHLALVQEYRDALAPHFALLLNVPGLGEALLDKARFQALAEHAGLPVPRPIEWEQLDGEPGPVLVKPKIRTAWNDSPMRVQLFGGDAKARVFESGRAARLDPRVRQVAHQLAFQEYVPGDDRSLWSFHGFAAPGGEVLQSFVGRKIRTFPALTGESSYLELAPNEELAALGRGIAARLALAGVFKMDFKRSAATGRFHLLEINARFNLWNYLGAANGVNLPQVAYEFLTQGKRPAPALARTRHRYLAFSYDRRAYRELKARGELGPARWLWSLARAPKVYELFAWSDPAPLLHFLRGRFRRRWQRLWHSTAS
jgi:D-aspartate ligase